MAGKALITARARVINPQHAVDTLKNGTLGKIFPPSQKIYFRLTKVPPTR